MGGAGEEAAGPGLGGLVREGAGAWAGAAPSDGRRADAGVIRLTGRDVAGLLWCGEMYGCARSFKVRMKASSAVSMCGCE
jgi:hypothetical protein